MILIYDASYKSEDKQIQTGWLFDTGIKGLESFGNFRKSFPAPDAGQHDKDSVKAKYQAAKARQLNFSSRSIASKHEVGKSIKRAFDVVALATIVRCVYYGIWKGITAMQATHTPSLREGMSEVHDRYYPHALPSGGYNRGSQPLLPTRPPVGRERSRFMTAATYTPSLREGMAKLLNYYLYVLRNT